LVRAAANPVTLPAGNHFPHYPALLEVLPNKHSGFLARRQSRKRDHGTLIYTSDA